MLRYRVTINDFSRIPSPYSASRVHRGLTLAQAWRKVEHAARRGLIIYGNPKLDRIRRANWGASGGAWPVAYRSAHIELDLGQGD